MLATLRLIAALNSSNGMVFDYSVPRSSLDTRNKAAFDALARRVRAAGEPFAGFFAPDELAREVKGMGFRFVEDLAADQINSRYFKNREDGLRVGGQLARLMCAWS